MKNKKLTIAHYRAINKAHEENNTEFLLKYQVRQVRWLYNNSNKCTMVYDEKLVIAMIQKLERKIKELEENQIGQQIK